MEQLALVQGGEALDGRIGQQLYALPAAQFVLRRLCDYLPPGGVPPAEVLSTEIVVQESPQAAQPELDLQWAQPREPEGSISSSDFHTARCLLIAMVEVLNRRRPLNQLVRHLDSRDYAAMQTRVNEVDRTSGGFRLLSVHASQPAKDAIEACATLEQNRRVRALVARLERTDSRWTCKALRIL